jgi:hypothetical protein
MRQAVLLVLVYLTWVPVGSAQGQDVSDEWQVRVAPYLWGMSIEGQSTIGTFPPVDIDAGFDDIFSNLNLALVLHTEFNKGPL